MPVWMGKIDPRIYFISLVVLLVGAVNLGWSPIAPNQEIQVTPTASSDVQATLTSTPLPPELLDNYQETTGVILVAGVVVLIIVASIFSELLIERRSRKS